MNNLIHSLTSMEESEFYEKFSNMEPMKYYENDLNLAKAQDILNNKDNGYIASLKRDGEWARVIILENSVLVQSRSVSKITGRYGDKTALIPHLIEEFKQLPIGTVILGELAFPDITKTSRDVGSILRCLPAKAIERQKENPLHFYAFDLIAYNYKTLTDVPYVHRLRMLDSLSEMQYFHFTERRTLDFMDFADEIWSQGGEGIVIHKLNTFYSPGTRTAWNSLKVKKKMEDLTVKVIDLIEPNKNYEGDYSSNWEYFVDQNDNRIDRLEIYNVKDLGELIPVTKPYWRGWKNGVVIEYQGRRVSVTSGLTDKIRAYLATEEALEKISNGTLYAIITGMELTADSIRHPIFKSLV